VLTVIEATLMIIGTVVVIGIIYSILMKDSLNKLFIKLKKNVINSGPEESVTASLAFSKLAIDDNAITPGRSLVPVTGDYIEDLENYDTAVYKSKQADTKLYPLF
jgi:hypothetical protein